jgi:hypothetical protein
MQFMEDVRYAMRHSYSSRPDSAMNGLACGDEVAVQRKLRIVENITSVCCLTRISRLRQARPDSASPAIPGRVLRDHRLQFHEQSICHNQRQRAHEPYRKCHFEGVGCGAKMKLIAKHNKDSTVRKGNALDRAMALDSPTPPGNRQISGCLLAVL